jgi:hypothetical protein
MAKAEKPYHIVRHSKSGQHGTGCGMLITPGMKTTGNSHQVTCSGCLEYIRETGDGPESLKALLRF